MSATPVAEPAPIITWDGTALGVQLLTPCALELHVDGVCFARWPAARRAAQQFDFLPGGQTAMQVQWFTAGVPLHPPQRVHWRQAGMVAAGGVPLPLAPLAAVDAAWRLDASVALLLAAAPVTVIVPVHNAAASFARCLTALRRHTPATARLLLIDDASSESEIAPLLAEVAAWPAAVVLRNEVNLGFSATVNRGLRHCGSGDVVLLNADTEVGPGWLGALRAAAWARADTATATAVSDNAGAFSVPELEQANALPDGWDTDDGARALRQHSGLIQPELPTGNGFCLYVRGDARAQVGELDAAAFPQGYGEENDWCQRALRLGWRHVIAGNVFVRHARSQSFGEARRVALGERGMAVLRQRYPRYEDDVGTQLWSFERRVLNWRVRRLWQAATRQRPRLVHVVSARGADWPDWAQWQLSKVDETTLRLTDAEGTERERGPVAEAPSHLLAWLQRHGIEAVVAGPAAPPHLAPICAALAIPCLPPHAEC